MSTKTIAVVTQVLNHLVSSAVHARIPGAEVTMLPPEKQAGAASDTPRVNLYLIQVVQHRFLNRERLPEGRPPDGKPPTVALDLRYMISFYGPSIPAQMLLGEVELAFTRSPFLDPALIRQATQGTPDLADSGLEHQQPQVCITRHPLSLEDMSRFWSGFFQSPYTSSVVFEASPVILRDEPGSAVPLVKTVDAGVHAERVPALGRGGTG